MYGSNFFLFQLALFPDVELNFLQDLALQHTGPYAVNNICNVLLEDQYPKAIAAPKATATATATIPNPEPDPVSLQKNRYCGVLNFRIPEMPENQTKRQNLLIFRLKDANGIANVTRYKDTRSFILRRIHYNG